MFVSMFNIYISDTYHIIIQIIHQVPDKIIKMRKSDICIFKFENWAIKSNIPK